MCRKIFVSFFLFFLLSCGGEDASTTTTLNPNADPVTKGNWYRPDVETTWQWQLDGEINTSYDVDLYDIDLFDVPDSVFEKLQSKGIRVICYFSAGSYEDFREDSGNFPQSVKGKPLDGFEDERWLDIRSEEVLAIMLERLDYAVERGCDGVEPDNVDGYTNKTGFDLKAKDQLAFNRAIANAAHERGLSVALNDGDQADDLVEYFDFVVNEQCHEYDECELWDVFVENGKPVFNAEYNVGDEVCGDSLDMDFRTLILPLDLDDSSRVSCDE